MTYVYNGLSDVMSLNVVDAQKGFIRIMFATNTPYSYIWTSKMMNKQHKKRRQGLNYQSYNAVD